MASINLRDELLCAICLSTYTDPVTLTCGHNFCRVCIDRMLDTQDGSGDYSCPACRANFEDRPSLMRNINLHNVAEHFKLTQPHQEEITRIRCTYCVDTSVPAVRSCLLCEASLCENHLRAHSKSPEHVLTDPTTSLENRKCSIHNRVLEYYCTDDAACICVSCSLEGEHRGHQVEMLDEASEKKKKKLGNVLQKLTSKRKKTEEKIRSLEERWRKGQEIAVGAVERVSAHCKDIRRQLDDLEKKVLSEISMREEQMSLSMSDKIQKVRTKKDELSRKMRHIEELCNMTDPLTVLQDPDTGDLCDPEEEGGDEDTGGHDGGDEDTEGHDGGDEDTEGHDGGDRVEEVISHISHTLCAIVKDLHVTFSVQDPADILLDVNTAANNLLISDDLKTATWTNIRQNRPETAERFQGYQVMSGRGFTSGRHYWDVEIRRSGWWRVGMCYPSIDRRGIWSYIGYNTNNTSWCLCGGREYDNQSSVIVRHNSKVIQLHHQISSDRVRICLDYEAGQLSFYELCDPIIHLHTFTAAFTEPLHAVLYVWGSKITISGRSS
ncbi:E3 ubiquitin-protein ligase TRIM39-like [Anomaloglossus baeobatrachus]|uniref:E3 ubiquitin-protein ligase TRIM39-like n=1 Tax=Anomaloglossus baeobatrachus TaxID=238106 RepID=UPI003F501824